MATSILCSLLIISLLGCTSEPSGTPAPAQTPAGKAALTPAPIAPSAVPTAIGRIEGEATNLVCDDLLSIQELYDFNPNFAIDPELPAVQTTIESQFTNLGGLTCSYLNLTSGEVIQVSIAKVKDSSKGALLASVSGASSAASDFDSEKRKAFFSLSNGTGVFQVVQGEYWLSASSSVFFSAADAYGFVHPALKRL